MEFEISRASNRNPNIPPVEGAYKKTVPIHYKAYKNKPAKTVEMDFWFIQIDSLDSLLELGKVIVYPDSKRIIIYDGYIE